MSKQNHDSAEKRAEQKALRRQKKKRPTMKVGGAGVKVLQKIIIAKSKPKV
jgi:hypothetical protein